VVCREADGHGRRLAAEYFPQDVTGLQTAGRIDIRTSGLVLVSNDAGWNNVVAGDPELDHEYRVQLQGELTELELTVMGAGIQLPGTGAFKPRSVTILEVAQGQTLLRATVGGGQIRPLRRMFAGLRHKILSLRRVRIGPVELGLLPMGQLRALTEEQVRELAPGHEAPGPPRT
jgi:23S rRNA pseudouridine2605 synthase